MAAMRPRWTADHVWQWSLLALLVGLAVGATSSLALAAYVLFRWVVPARGWWSILDGVELGLLALLLGGTTGAAIGSTAVEWAGRWTGASCCPRCYRPQIGRRPCSSCTAAAGLGCSPSVWQRVWRWCRPHLLAATVIFIGCVLLSVPAVWLTGRHRKLGPLPGELAFAHFALCLLFILVAEGADVVLEWLNVAGPLRRRWKPRVLLISIYLIGFTIVAAFRAS